MKRILLTLSGIVFFWWVVVPLFERFAPREAVRAYQRFSMPFFRPLAGLIPGWALVETTGRRSGRPHRVPLGARKSGPTVWVVCGVGRDADYVRNIERDPRVRVKVNGRWCRGTASLCPDDDAKRRAMTISPLNGLFLLGANLRPLSIRIDLDAVSDFAS